MSTEKHPTDETKEAEKKVEYREDTAGPQGTLVFDSKQVDKLIAQEIQKQESDTTKVAALVATTKPHIGQQFILQAGKNLIGRGKGNSVTIYDPAVSSTHAQITGSEGQWKILNLLSSNGTVVNGEKVSDRVLSYGDKISIGQTEFLFTLVDEPKEQDHKEKKDYNWLAISAAAIAVAALLLAIIFIF